MKKFMLIVALLASNLSFADDIYCKSTNVISGDTFICKTEDNKEITVKLYQAIAPQKGQPYYNESKEELSKRITPYYHYTPNVIHGRSTLVKQKEKGKAEVYTEDICGGAAVRCARIEPVSIPYTLIKEGLLWYYPFDGKNLEYEQAQEEAKKNKVGLWADKNPVAPWEFIKQT